MTPKTTINAKVVQAIKKLQALYNNYTNKNVKQATQKRSANKNLNFFIDLVLVANDTKQNLDELQMFNKAWNHPNEES